jgi:hypothetical protein
VTELPDVRRRREVAEYITNPLRSMSRARLSAAVEAVLVLRPPQIDHDDDLEYEAAAIDGWWTCHSAVVRALHTALGLGQ